MKAQAFLDWMATTGTTTAGEFAERVGISRNPAQEMFALAKAGDEVPVKRTVALAMTALANGLKPWDAYER